MPENRMDDGGQGQQPREKLLLTGPQELSAVELIAVLLGSGCRATPFMRLRRRCLNWCEETCQCFPRFHL